MLLSFRVANHGSLREPQELNLVPAYADERPALTVVALFGANASGKSTVLDAMDFFVTAVMESQARWLPDAPIPRRPFLLDRESRNEPSTYAVDLLIEGVRYVYGFGVTDTEVAEEWLYAYPKGRKRVLFERTGMAMEYGASLTGNRVQVERTLRPNSLYLAAASQSAHRQLTPVWRAVTRVTIVDDGMRQSFAHVGALHTVLFDQLARVGLRMDEAMLSAADLGVQGVRRNAKQRNSLHIPIPPDRLDGITEEYQAAAADAMEFVHRVGGEEFFLPAELESAGTKTWLQLMTFALNSLVSGGPLFIDEIDISLHPLLTAELVKIFQDPELNPGGGQLVFTTHSASLLGTMLGEQVLRRDQVWFVEKDAQTAASTLYPLSDFKPRKGENFERRYLAGSYGAVPLLPDTGFEEIIKAMWGARDKSVPA